MTPAIDVHVIDIAIAFLFVSTLSQPAYRSRDSAPYDLARTLASPRRLGIGLARGPVMSVLKVRLAALRVPQTPRCEHRVSA